MSSLATLLQLLLLLPPLASSFCTTNTVSRRYDFRTSYKDQSPQQADATQAIPTSGTIIETSVGLHISSFGPDPPGVLLGNISQGSTGLSVHVEVDISGIIPDDGQAQFLFHSVRPSADAADADYPLLDEHVQLGCKAIAREAAAFDLVCLVALSSGNILRLSSENVASGLPYGLPSLVTLMHDNAPNSLGTAFLYVNNSLLDQRSAQGTFVNTDVPLILGRVLPVDSCDDFVPCGALTAYNTMYMVHVDAAFSPNFSAGFVWSYCTRNPQSDVDYTIVMPLPPALTPPANSIKEPFSTTSTAPVPSSPVQSTLSTNEAITSASTTEPSTTSIRLTAGGVGDGASAAQADGLSDASLGESGNPLTIAIVAVSVVLCVVLTGALLLVVRARRNASTPSNSQASQGSPRDHGSSALTRASRSSSKSRRRQSRSPRGGHYDKVRLDTPDDTSEGYRALPTLEDGGASGGAYSTIDSAASNGAYATGPLGADANEGYSPIAQPRAHGYGTVGTGPVTYGPVVLSRKGTAQSRTHAYATLDVDAPSGRSHGYGTVEELSTTQYVRMGGQ